MTPLTRTRLTRLAAAAAALTLAATLSPAPALAGSQSPPGAQKAAAPARTTDVMTRNLYLGAGLEDIVEALESGDQTEIVLAATATWGTVQASDPADRMAAIADEIVASNPAAVGLQEVTTWTTYPRDPVTGALGAPTVAYDFLELLLAALADRGVTYHEVAGATATNFTPPAPIPVLVGGVPSQAVSLTDRDVILRRDDVKAWNGRNGNFDTILKPPAFPLRIDRGWGSADLRTRLATLRFVNTHTEAFGPEIIRIGEITELFAAQQAVAAESGALPTVYVGDFNSAPGQGGYQTLAAQLGDAWTATQGTADGFTCCQDADLTNATSVLDERIDLVMIGDGVTATRSHLTGTTPVDLPGDTRWASDHAGVVARIVID